MAGRKGGEDPAAPDVPDDVIQVGMQHGFTAADRNDGDAQIGQPIETLFISGKGTGGENASNSLQ